MDIHGQRLRLLAVFLVCLTVFGILAVYRTTLLTMYPRPKQHEVNTTQSNKTTTILVWYWPFGDRFSVDGNVCKEWFGIPKCILVDDRSMFAQADFVIFHNRELITGQQSLPTHLTRAQNQGWVWFSLESPAHNGNTRPFNGLFNYTMSYRRDADFYAPYGRLVPQDFGTGLTVEDFIPKNKSFFACWVVSNFAAHHKRTAIYNRLKTIIPVQVYGGAVNNRIPYEILLPTINRCYFYLAFENSLFKDYISWKFWYNGLMGGAVPVVLGPPREDYEAVAPKDSFIHVDDFRSLEELGEFLKNLANDKERYASYFNWKLKYTVKKINDCRDHLCSICKNINSLPKHKLYEDFDVWESE